LEFLNSPDARLVRMLTEYLEPRHRFKHQKVKDTIVFFGSSKIVSREEAEKQFGKAKELYNSSSTKENAKKFKIAQKQLEMSQYYEDARTLANLITRWSMQLGNNHRRYIVASGGGPGIMEAANRGAIEVKGGKSIGLNISIPSEQTTNPFITDKLNFEFHYFFMRKFWFIYLAKALVVFPGGFGTMDELWEVLTLIQTKKVQKKMPIIIYGEKYWKQIINFDAMVENLVIGEKDLNLLHFSNNPQEAFEFLSKKLLENHSL
jgi:uncharacterized protein (TIGR00730 family)